MYSNLISQIISYAAPILASILIIRLLTVKDFGTFSLFLSFLSLFGGLSLGIHHVYQRYAALYADDKSDTSRLLKLTIFTFVVRVVIFTALLWVIRLLHILNVLSLNAINFPYVSLAVLTTALVITRLTLHEGLLSAYFDYRFFNFFNNSITMLKIVLILLLRPTSLIALIYIWVFCEVIRVSVFTVRLFSKMNRDRISFQQRKPQGLEFARYFKYGRYFLVATVASQILAFDIDNYFLSYFKGNEAVGLYSFAGKVAFALVGFAPANILFNFVTPYFIKDYAKNRDLSRLRNFTNVLFKLNVFVYAGIVLFLCVNLSYFIEVIFQGKYQTAVSYVFILIAFSFFPVIKNTFEPVARGIEKSSVYFFTFVAAILNVLGNILLIPRLGIMGAIVSTGIAISLQCIAFIVFARREVGISIDTNYILRLIVNLLPLILIGYFVQHRISSLLNFFVINAVLVMLYVAIFRANRCFSNQESSFINSFLPKRLFIF